VPCVYGAAPKNGGHVYIDAESVRRDLRCPLTKIVSLTMESEAIYARHKLTAATFRSVDVLSTTRLDSDVPAFYGDWWEYDFYSQLQPKTADAVAVAIISNCGPTERLEYLRALAAAGLAVHSMGSCLNNHPRPPKHNWQSTKTDALRPYKFYLAFENSAVDDYVTEKFFQALVAGAVPVVMGLENIADFAPAPNSFIHVSDFASPAALAEYLKFLDANDDAYYEYLAWKREGVSEQFERLLASTTGIHIACRICRWIKNVYDVELGEKTFEEAFPDLEPVLPGWNKTRTNHTH